MRTKKISTLLLFRTVILSIAIGAVASAVLITVNLGDLREDQQKQTAKLVELAAGSASTFAFEMDAVGASRFLDGLAQVRSVQSVQLLNEFGEEIAAAGDAVRAGGDVIELGLDHPSRPGTPIGTLRLTVDWSADNARFVRRSIEEVVASVLVALLLGGALYFVFRGALTKPLSRIVAALGADRAHGDESPLSARKLVPVKSVEMVGLVDALNALKHDVAVRERALLELRESTLSELFESAPDAMLIADQGGRIVRHNERLTALFGYAHNELDGLSVEGLMPERFRAGHAAMMSAYFQDPLAREMGSGFELAGLRKNGEEFPLEIGLSPFHETDGVMAVASIRDITARKLAEATNRRLSKVFMDASDPIVIEDLEGVVSDLNHAAVEAYGWEREELIGRPIKRLVPVDRHAQADRLLGRCLAGEDVRDVEGFRVTRDGTVLNVLLTLSLLRDERNEPFAVASIVKNITALKTLEGELIDATRRAEAANLAKSQFLSHMSHELRTPLNGVLGYAQILQRDDATTKQRESLDAIVSCGTHLLALINDILDLSKIEAGKLDVRLAPCDLHRVIREVSDVVSQRAAAAGLGFDTDVAPEVPQGVMADAAKLRQILVNLLGNAVKFTKAGGVTMRVTERPKGRLRFEVIDTGVGMSAEDVEQIFDPFKQVDAGKAAGGTGLGLAITHRLVTAMDGRIEVESEPGVGTTFVVELPLEESGTHDFEDMPEEALHLGAARLPRGVTCRVLVADDRETNRDILAQMLESIGIQPILTDDGDTAIEALRSRDDIDLVLMDVRMPRMNGIEAVREIRADESLRRMKVIAVTASVFPEFREKAIRSGFDDFIGKPFRTEELIAKLARHLEIDFVTDGEPAAGAAGDPGLDHDLATEAACAIAERIRAALKLGNITALNELAEELTGDDATSVIGDRIGQLARAFDFNGLAGVADRLSAAEEA